MTVTVSSVARLGYSVLTDGCIAAFCFFLSGMSLSLQLTNY